MRSTIFTLITQVPVLVFVVFPNFMSFQVSIRLGCKITLITHKRLVFMLLLVFLYKVFARRRIGTQITGELPVMFPLLVSEQTTAGLEYFAALFTSVHS